MGTAPYLPWVMFLLSLLLGHSATEDLMGIAVGHTYYFFEDVYPLMADIRGYRVRRWLAGPTVLQQICGELRDESETPRIVATENVINAEPADANGETEADGGDVEGTAAAAAAAAAADAAEQETETQHDDSGRNVPHQHQE